MVEIILELLRLNSGLIISVLLAIIAIFVAIIFITVVVQGREFHYGKLIIGKKHESFESFGAPDETPQTELDIDGIAERVKEKIAQEKSSKEIPTFTPPKLSEQQIYLFSARQDIRVRLIDIVLSHGGGWAGVSMASFNKFYNLAKDNNLISKRLASDIHEFMIFTRELLNEEDVSGEGIEIAKEFYELIRIQLNSISRTSLEQG